MSDVIQGLLQQALGDAARSTKFEAYINFNTPALGPENTEVYMHVKTAMFPGKSHEVIDLRFKGRSIPIRGQVKYDNTWTCSFYLTEGHELKIAFENWIESLDQTQNMSQNLAPPVQAGQAMVTQYASEMMIAQMDFKGESHTSIYTLHNIFPKNVSAVQVDYSETGSILEYTVEFSYSHYTSVQVGGVKLPAKTGGGSSVPGMSNVSGAGSPNFSPGGGGSNIGDTLKNAGQNALNSAVGSILDSVNQGARNIASNVTGEIKGAVIGAFDSAKREVMKPVDRVKNQVQSGINSALNGASNFIKSFR